jgi:hypothetical protein
VGKPVVADVVELEVRGRREHEIGHRCRGREKQVGHRQKLRFREGLFHRQGIGIAHERVGARQIDDFDGVGIALEDRAGRHLERNRRHHGVELPGRADHLLATVGDFAWQDEIPQAHGPWRAGPVVAAGDL